MTIDLSDPPVREGRKSRVLNQGVMLAGGYFAAQSLSFLRNAMIGHALSKGDFGIAATITLMLQLIEMISDIGSDRLIVQAKDGASDAMLAASHTILVVRGVLICLTLLAAAPMLSRLFNVPEATHAFQLVGLASLIRGFVHLDWRRAQRRLDNGPHLAIEILPQAVALAATLPILFLVGGYSAVVGLAILQSLTALIVSHALADSRYRLAIDAELLKRQFAFGWPILLAALPLTAVYQLDRIVIGSTMGVEVLAGYSAAFLATMIPGVLAAKAGHALMLPLLSESHRNGGGLRPPFVPLTEGAVVFAAMYLVGFVICGGSVLPLMFGDNYSGLGAVVAWLAGMWAVRMIQTVPGMAIMATGETRPFAVAAFIRAGALPQIVVAVHHGATLPQIAAIGCAFEVLALLYVAWRLNTLEDGLGRKFIRRASFLVPAGLCSLAIFQFGVLNPGVMFLAALTSSVLTGIAGVAVMPTLRAKLRDALSGRSTAFQAF